MYLPYLRQWMELKQTIGAMDESSSNKELFCQIQLWLRKYPKVIAQNDIAEYRLERFAELNVENYPINTSSQHPTYFAMWQSRFIKLEVRKWGQIAQHLSATLEDLIVVETEITCSNCESTGLGFYFDKLMNNIALECRQCGYAKHVDGSKVADSALRFATKENLRQAGIYIDYN